MTMGVHVGELTFDIFSGTSDKDAIWLECVDGLSEARNRMEHIAAVRPGAYFLYSHASRSMLERTNTVRQLQSAPKKTKASAA